MQVPFTPSHFKHPLASHSALDVLGYRRNGAPIYAIAGGNGEGEGGSESGGQSGSGESGQSGQGGSEGSGKAGDQGGQQSGQESGEGGAQSGDDKDWKAHAREWEKRAKANANAAAELEKLRAAQMTEQEKAVAAAEKAGRTAAAQELQAEIDKREAQLRELTIRDAVRDRADKLGAKPAALLNSLSFRERIKELDPASKAFGANLEEAVKAELKDHPEFAAQAAGKSGADLSSGTGENGARQRPTSLSAAVRGTFNT